MEFLHHQPMLRDEDGVYICSRCELVNPTNDTPCVPLEVNPSSERSSERVAGTELLKAK